MLHDMRNENEREEVTLAVVFNACFSTSSASCRATCHAYRCVFAYTPAASSGPHGELSRALVVVQPDG